MAEKTGRDQGDRMQGMSHFREAIEHNMTTSRLVAAGAVALGAAATAYFWDPQRREAFLDTGRRLSDDVAKWWSGFYAGPESASTDRSANRP